ncbi:MAG: hypothetical protein AB7S38_14655 [Vulcanimicrobiota bacterium]
MAAKCELVDLYNKETIQNLPAPGDGESYAVFRVAEFTEAGIHGFIRLVPAVGLSMSRSSIPKEKAARIGQLAAQVVETLEDGKISDFEIFMLMSAIRQLNK